MTTPTWTPAVELDLETAGGVALQEAIEKFAEWAKTAPPLPTLTMQNGWYDITAETAESLLRRNSRNRKVSLATVKKYYHAMKIGEWKRTGQPVLINQDGKVEDAQHRLWACYFGKVTFPTYIVTDVPVAADLFAYIDDNKVRSAADALYTSGTNGLSSTLAGTIKLAWRYDNMAIAIFGPQPRIRDMTNIEVMEYARNNPDLIAAAHTLGASYKRAARIIDNRPVAAFFAWRVIRHYGIERLDEFMDSLGSGALLTEDSPILALRNRLLTAREESFTKGEDMRAPRRLALLIKAFLMHVQGQKITGKKGTSLTMQDNDVFPRIEPDNDLLQAAE
jgi:hypothetical protein